MLLIRNLDEVSPETLPGPLALTIGVFDGLHRAHQVLIRKVREAAGRHKASAAIFTFDNHPLSILAPAYCPKRLSSSDQMIELLRALELHVAIIVPFTAQLAEIEPQQFLKEFLAERCRCRHVVAGFDFRFGRGGKGDAELLRREGAALGIEVEIVEPQREGSYTINSTRIRELLFEGNVEGARDLLGRPYQIESMVVRGHARGAKIGFPTANLYLPPDLVVPAPGVYAARAILASGEAHPGMMNIGYQPTFGGTSLCPEIHLLGFKGDLYGSRLRVDFIARLRDEKKFPSVEALKRQLAKDRRKTLEIFRSEIAPH